MKVLRIIAALTLAFAVAFTIFFGRYKIEASGVDTTPEQYKGIITMWQIDSFEGGIGSRKQFLLKAARSFEKSNSGVLIMVIDQTVEGAKENIKEGVYPDLISFGAGADISGFSELFVEQKVLGGMVGDKCFATAWCRGGYALISNPLICADIENLTEIESLLVSQGQYTQPLAALAFEGIVAKNVEVLAPMDAYVKFVSGKTPYFLGTQRDVNRLLNRGFEFRLKPINEYNDLYQYVCITGKEQVKRYYSEKFIEHLLSEKVQKSLSEIGMYSPYFTVDYEINEHNLMQKIQSKITVSAFTSSEQLKEMQTLSLLFYKGDKEALNKIKKLCVMP